MAEDTRCCGICTDAARAAFSHGHVSPTAVLYHINLYFTHKAPLAFQCCAPQARLFGELHEAWLHDQPAHPPVGSSVAMCAANPNASPPASPSSRMESEALHWTRIASPTSPLSSAAAGLAPSSPIGVCNEVNHGSTGGASASSSSSSTNGCGSAGEESAGVMLRLSAQRHGTERDAVVTDLTSLELMRWWLLRSGVAGVAAAPYPLRSIEFRLSEKMSDAALEAQAEMFFLLCSSTLRRLVFNGRNDVHTHLRGLSCIALLQQLTELNLRHTTVDYRAECTTPANTNGTSCASKDRGVRTSWAADTALLRVLRHLEYLVVGDYYLPRQLPLAELHSLRVIDLSGTGLDDTALAALATCDKLERVLLAGCVGVVNWAPLAALTRMRVLDLQGTRIDDATLTTVCAACPALTYLNLSDCLFLRNCPALGQLTQLATVQLARTNCSPLTIRSLATLPALRTLSLRGVAREDLFVPVSFAASLRELDCHGYALTEEGLESVCHTCPRLRRCVLSGVRYVADFTPLAKLRELRWLNVSGTCFDDRALDLVVQACRKLEALLCFGCQGIKSFACVAELLHLRVLNVSDTTMDDASLCAIAARCPALEELSLHFCRRLRDLGPLRQCTRLKRLGLGGVSVSEASVGVLQSLAQRGVVISTQLQLLHMAT